MKKVSFLKTWMKTGELLKDIKIEMDGESLTIEAGVEVSITVTTIYPIEKTERPQTKESETTK